MSDPRMKSQGTQPPPSKGHPLPRRATPDTSITLQHHRLARDASMMADMASAGAAPHSRPPRRTSSGESHYTGRSDPKTWFDHSNQNPSAALGGNEMDVDPPFFQRESESSNESGAKDAYRYDTAMDSRAMLRPKLGRQSSSTDEYRSVIDDLTVEIQRLKEQLKRYKQGGPDVMKGEKLFEVKMHGLPKRKKRELEAKLRDFAASIDGTSSSNATSSQRKKSSRGNIYSGTGSISKHASSSTGSHSRPVDSAYASMSTGRNSSGTSLSRPSMSSRGRMADQKVENYLRDIPEGLYPRHMAMTEKDKKKLVVRRLEQLFTGKITGRHFRSAQSGGGRLAPIVPEAQQPSSTAPPPPPPLATSKSVSRTEPSREACIVSSDMLKKNRYRDDGSASNSNGDQTESGGNGTGTGTGNGKGNGLHGTGNGNGNGSRSSNSGGPNVSPPGPPPPPEQRPTRPKDLDPDRVQVPSENMEYIRHLGLVPPELLPESKSTQDVSPDAEGWVYLNLLANLAQLHMINVAPDFIRSAVSEKSTKLQLSPDGRKIRWRGGCDGTRFSSDSSGDNWQKSPSTDESDGSNKDGQRKRARKMHTSVDASAYSSNMATKSGAYGMGPSEYDSFHYEPIFTRRESSNEQTSLDDTWSSCGPGENSDPSGWGQSGEGEGQRKKRRHGGAIIYYSGAPFCTDLSGDPGEVSPTSYLEASRQQSSNEPAVTTLPIRPPPARSESGSLIPFRPLSQRISGISATYEMVGPSRSPQGQKRGRADGDDDEDDIDLRLSWSADTTGAEPAPANVLEPSGLGGVTPEDHFVVQVKTKRPKLVGSNLDSSLDSVTRTKEAANAIARRLAAMTTSSPGRAVSPTSSRKSENNIVGISYVSGWIKRLAPMPLPPPVTYIPPFSSDDSDDSIESTFEADDDLESSSELTSRRANQHRSDNSLVDDVDAPTSDDEEAGALRMDDESDAEMRGVPTMNESGQVGPGAQRGQGSSVATAGGRESGYSSSDEEED